MDKRAFLIGFGAFDPIPHGRKHQRAAPVAGSVHSGT